jgi:dTDP-glucose pyrophosphorylase
MKDLPDHIILSDKSLITALEKLNSVPLNLSLFVLDKDGRMVGTLTDGDVRRGLIAGKKVTDCVSEFMIRDFYYLTMETLNTVKVRAIKSKGIKLLPILDSEKRIVQIIDFNKVETLLPVEAVLMAGGRGERLQPLTNTIPKPLLPLGSKTIIDYNIENLAKYGINRISISIKYLGEQIIDHFSGSEFRDIDITFISEKEPLGTIGALKQIAGFKEESVLVMNSDLFTNIDLEAFYLHFIESKATMSVASIPYNINIPYAVLDLEDNEIKAFREKPTMTYYSNAGIYLFKKEIVENIPENSLFHATDLIEVLIKKGEKVTYFPIIGYWIDIGKPEDYKKAQEFIKYL